ncbi:hypothetical protein HIV01_001120 [Lysobacter arenosi]|uniref:HEPN AbiU2-like domain-containing protein n=1 Tax=Lysobacter arenosi TaxID=2795387 RepID=A0ABX7RAN8_9GAMM|nr:hypothetical protein [Lysobacter arenosi]QSX75203.1 hypothetical protein HIV01_001120 [Lysobacter arenosi]
MNDQPLQLTVHLRLGAYYALDAKQFFDRYLMTCNVMEHSAWKFKCFTDLLMAAECALKAHICAASNPPPAAEMLRGFRNGQGHKIDDLADLAHQSSASPIFERVKALLGRHQVHLRYSLEAEQGVFILSDLSYKPHDASWANIATNAVEDLISALPRFPDLPKDWDQRVAFERELYVSYRDSFRRKRS